MVLRSPKRRTRGVLPVNWLNLRTSRLRDPSFIGSDPVERGTWLCVIAYCVELENGGIIVGAKLWKDRQWQQACGVTLKEVMKSERLLKWDGYDLIVWEYPCDKEKEVSHKREVAKENGKLGGRPRLNPETNEEPTPVISHNQRPKAEGEGKEKGIGKEGETPKAPRGATASPSLGNGSIPKDNLPTTEPAKRIAAICHRDLTTRWSDKEIAAFKKLKIEADHLNLLEAYYSANWPPKTGVNMLRHDLGTLLNNFSGEVDRARNWATPKNGNGVHAAPQHLNTDEEL